jgi:hypothetical protein
LVASSLFSRSSANQGRQVGGQARIIYAIMEAR